MKKNVLSKHILNGIFSMLFILFLSFAQTSNINAASDWTVHHSANLGFDSIYKAGDEYIIGKKDGKVAIWNQTTGKVVVSDYNYINSIWDISNAVIYKSVDKDLYEFATMNCSTGKITNKLGKYTALDVIHIIDEYNGSIIYATRKNGKATTVGIINEKGKILIPVEFDAIEYIGADYTGNTPVYYLKCGKKNNGKMLYALYTSDGTQLTECKYTDIYKNSTGQLEKTSSDVLAKDKAGNIGIIINGKEIGLNNTLANIDKDSVYLVQRIVSGKQEYIVKCIYKTADIYNNGTGTLSSNPSWSAKEHNLSTLSENPDGVSYEFFDLKGNKISKDTIIQELSNEIKPHEKLKATILDTGLKKSNQIDFNTLFDGTGMTVTKTEIDDNGKFICDDNTLKISITLTTVYRDEDDDEHLETYDAVAYFDIDGKLIQYGLSLVGDDYDGIYVLRCKNDEIHLLDLGSNKDEIVFTDKSKTYYSEYNDNCMREKKSFLIHGSYDKNFLYIPDAHFASECYGYNLSWSTSGDINIYTSAHKTLIEKKSEVYYINEYDSNWKLIKSSELKDFGTGFYAHYQEDESEGALVIHNDAKYLAVLPDGDSILINRADDKLFKNMSDKLCYANGKYYVRCSNNSESGIYCLNDKKFIFRYDRDILKANLQDDYMVVKDKIYWTYEIYNNNDYYYGLIDETGSIVVDAISNKYVSAGKGYSSDGSGEYSYICFRDVERNENYYYGNPLKKHNEKPNANDILIDGSKTDYNGIVYWHKFDSCSDKGNTQALFYEYVYDTDGNLLAEAHNQENKRSMAIFEKTKKIIIADSFWDGKPKSASSIDEKQIPALKTKLRDASGATYTVTKSNAKNGTVAFTRPKNNKVTSVNIPAKVKINGIIYKVTS